MRSNASHVPFVSSAVSQKAAAMALYNINPPHAYKGAHKTVILKITIMASVRRDWQRNNGYLVKAGYPLFFAVTKSNGFIHSFQV